MVRRSSRLDGCLASDSQWKEQSAIPSSDLAARSTIALLPLKASNNQEERETGLLQLASTLASLWRVGIGRVTVVGVSEREERLALDAFNLIQEKGDLVVLEI